MTWADPMHHCRSVFLKHCRYLHHQWNEDSSIYAQCRNGTTMICIDLGGALPKSRISHDYGQENHRFCEITKPNEILDIEIYGRYETVQGPLVLVLVREFRTTFHALKNVKCFIGNNFVLLQKSK